MSLGADDRPDTLIKEGLKQPNQIKISFKKNSKDSNSKEITGHVAPNQARFGTEYFLAYTLPDFKSKILNQLLDTQKDNGPLLFSLMGQCFNNADCTKANFNNCIKDYLEAIARFPNIGDQLICWFCTSKKPALMPINEFMRH
jgi:hypothetical protein